MKQLEKTIIRLYQSGYVSEAIARATGEDRTYVDYILDSYLGPARTEPARRELRRAAHASN